MRLQNSSANLTIKDSFAFFIFRRSGTASVVTNLRPVAREDSVAENCGASSRTPTVVDRTLVRSATTSAKSLISEIRVEAERYGQVSTNAVEKAASWLSLMSSMDLPSWHQPRISASPEEEVVFEWWAGKRKISVYFGDEETVLLRVWGPNICEDMLEHPPEDISSVIRSWGWLISVS